MKKFLRLLILSLLFVLIMNASASANTRLPRWPEPAWFAQFSLNPAPAPVPQPPPPSVPQTSILTAPEQYIFEAINAERVARGLVPLKINAALVELARKKSQDMIENNYFSHRSPVYGSAYDMMRSAGVRYSFAAENLARTTSAVSAVTLFMNSGIHRRTLLNARYSETGIGVLQEGRQIYITQMFIGFRR